MRMQVQSFVGIGQFRWILAALLGLMPVTAVAQQVGAAPPEPTAPQLREPAGDAVIGYRPLMLNRLAPPAQESANADAPASARPLLDQFEQQKAALRIEMEKKIERQQLALVAQLKELAARLDQTGSIREAQAVRDYLQKFQPAPAAAQADPGTLQNYRDRVGQTFVFEVVGQLGSTIWGDGIYTDDSAISVAAVHSGILQVGEKALVQVRIMPGQASYNGTFRNGVHSNPYGPWEGSYSISSYHRSVVMASPAKAGDPHAKPANPSAGA